MFYNICKYSYFSLKHFKNYNFLRKNKYIKLYPLYCPCLNCHLQSPLTPHLPLSYVACVFPVFNTRKPLLSAWHTLAALKKCVFVVC